MEFSTCANPDQFWEKILRELSRLKATYVKEKSAHPKFPLTNHPRTKGLIRRKSRLTSAIGREADEEKKRILVECRDLLDERL